MWNNRIEIQCESEIDFHNSIQFNFNANWISLKLRYVISSGDKLVDMFWPMLKVDYIINICHLLYV